MKPDEQREQVQEQLRAVYTPARPVRDPKLLSGRDGLLASSQGVVGTVTAFLLFGEPGVGKTSFALSLFAGKRIGLHTCSSRTDMPSVFGDLIDKLDAGFIETERTTSDELTSSVGVDKVVNIGTKMQEGSKAEKIFKPTLDLNYILSELERQQDKFDVLMIDEFHRVEDHTVHQQLLELIKGCADRGLSLTIVVAGQADRAEELVKSDELPDYFERSIVAIKIPPLNPADLLDILIRRERLFKIKIDSEVKEKIVYIAGRSMTLVHRIALSASSAWLLRAFTYHLTHGLQWLLRLLRLRGEEALSLDKVGVTVEMEDLRSGLRLWIDSFEAGNPEAAQQYRSARADPAAKTIFPAVLATEERPVRYEEIAKHADVSSEAVREVVLDCSSLFTPRGEDAFEIEPAATLAYLRAQEELHPWSDEPSVGGARVSAGERKSTSTPKQQRGSAKARTRARRR
jgi:hypothetical protein